MMPEHVGLILDGNRRWAKERGKQPWDGHREGAETVKKILAHAEKKGINHITMYVWSLKNESGRSKEERRFIFNIFVRGFKDLFKEAKKKKIRVQFLGQWERADGVTDIIADVTEKTKHFTGKTLNFCFMYDGQQEIVDACNEAIKSGEKELTPEKFKKYLYTKDIPPMDLIIRTGMSDGCRLSGFMLWDSSYAELIFHDTYWPAYTIEMFDEDVEEFEKRNRRFGA